jgi:hypothetical protein
MGATVLRRAWLTLSLLWAALALWGGMGRQTGLEGKDFVLALAPGSILFGAWLVLRFIVTGSFARPRAVPYRRP